MYPRIFKDARRVLCILLLSLFVFGEPLAYATTYYVATNGKDTNTGTQAKPFLTIQKAVNRAAPGDTVLVADGTYSGTGNINIDFGGADITVASLSNNPANCILDCQQAGRAFYLHTNETTNSLIQGFTIKNGNGNGGNGGGISISSSKPKVTNCTFIGNTVINANGGGMSGGAAANCIFTGNTASSYAGGMYQGTAANCTFVGNAAYTGGGLSFGTATNCTFIGNKVNYGAGMSDSTAINCTFTGNAANLNGGGMYGGTATNCTFTGNTSSFGGGIYGGTATNCIFTGNAASASGGGMSGGTATNCVFTRNSASGNGGGVTSASCLYFCTIANNSAEGSGGGISGSNATNCIIWDNTAGSNPNVSGSGTIAYSDVQGGYTGTGNLNADPLFANPDADDFHLMTGSPGINSATTTVPTDCAFPAADLDGGNRVVGNAPDMGAYEVGNSLSFSVVHVFGKVLLRQLAATAPVQRVTFQFRPTDGSAATTISAYVAANGYFALSLPNGSYDLWVKPDTFLASLVPVTVSNGLAYVTAAVQPGDGNNDNLVDVGDFGVLVNAFGATGYDPTTGYDARADFNGDGSVDLGDFGLLVNNFGESGDP